MNGTEEKQSAKKVTLTQSTRLLFHIAARSHSLCDFMGIDLDKDERLTFRSIPRPWLVPNPGFPDEVTFDADIFAKYLDTGSTYECHMRRWIINVWNPGYAKHKGWTFDLFKALRGLDDGNRNAIVWWLQHDIWP